VSTLVEVWADEQEFPNIPKQSGLKLMITATFGTFSVMFQLKCMHDYIEKMLWETDKIAAWRWRQKNILSLSL